MPALRPPLHPEILASQFPLAVPVSILLGAPGKCRQKLFWATRMMLRATRTHPVCGQLQPFASSSKRTTATSGFRQVFGCQNQTMTV
eukprot:g13882.t1